VVKDGAWLPMFRVGCLDRREVVPWSAPDARRQSLRREWARPTGSDASGERPYVKNLKCLKRLSHDIHELLGPPNLFDTLEKGARNQCGL
jgi:hypothetical protein